MDDCIIAPAVKRCPQGWGGDVDLQQLDISGQVIGSAGAKVIYHHWLMTPSQQSVYYMGADEASSTGD